MIQHWPNGMDLYFNPDKTPLSIEHVESAIAYISWIIKERTNIDIRYRGTTDQRTINGSVVLEFGDFADFEDLAKYDFNQFLSVRGTAARYHYIGQPYVYGRTLINSMYIDKNVGFSDRRVMRTLVHEILHNLGSEHSETPGAVMNKSILAMYPPNYGMMCEDYMAVQRGGNHSFIELTRENDLWIPCVEGKAADLVYTGDGITHKWKLRSIRDAGPMQVPSAIDPVNPEKPDLVLRDVRSQTYKLSLAKLDYDLSKEEWTLIYAE